MKKFLFSELLFLVLLLLVAASPYPTIFSMCSSIAEQNSVKLAQHIDFPVLRRNLKTHIQVYITALAGKIGDNHLKEAIVSVSKQATYRVIDRVVVPHNIPLFLEPYVPKSKVTGFELFKEVLTRSEQTFPTFSEFHLAFKDKTLILVFKRTGVHWKLTNIIIPVRQIVPVLQKLADI